jgi:hypothetical protein
VVRSSVSGGLGGGGVAICPKSLGGSTISIESFLSSFSTIFFFGFGKILIIGVVGVLGASIVGVMIMRVIDLMMIFHFNFFQMLIIYHFTKSKLIIN